MDKILLGLTYLRPGQFPASRDVQIAVTPGEGAMLLDPNTPPALGTLQQGRLVIASESFPRFAPLTLTLAGADLRFVTRNGRLLSFALRDRGEDSLKISCQGIYRAAFRYALHWVPETRVTLRRFNSLDGDRETRLALNVLKGSIAPGGAGFEREATGRIRWGALEIRRAADGEMKLQLHGARMEWDVANGTLTGLRVYDSRGVVGHFNLFDHSGAGVTASVSVLDTLP